MIHAAITHLEVAVVNDYGSWVEQCGCQGKRTLGGRM